MRSARCLGLALSVLVLAAASDAARAWGASGHRMASRLGLETLPAEIPAFLRTPRALAWGGELGREPDRSKGSGASHDQDLDPGHFLNLGDDGLVAGILPLAPLPANRRDYDGALRAGGSDQYRAGYLPYAIVDGWQQIRKDFAYWRADAAAARRSRSPREKAWFEEDRRLREMLLLRDIGYWSHFVGDASQPLHVSSHHDGWGDGPNPEGFTTDRIHAAFEGAFVRAEVDPRRVRARMAPPRRFDCAIETRVVAYLRETAAQVRPLYRLEQQGAFGAGRSDGRAFAEERLAAAAAEIRDLVTAAWFCSAEAEVGYPPRAVRDVEAGKRNPLPELQGLD